MKIIFGVFLAALFVGLLCICMTKLKAAMLPHRYASAQEGARVNGTLARITCDTLANYGDLLDKRIKDALGRSSRKVYTGDAINYFLSLVANNINSLLRNQAGILGSSSAEMKALHS